MKLTKKNMTKFDFVAKKIFFFSMIALVLTVAFVLPLSKSIEDKCYELNKDVQSLEIEKTVLINDLQEIENPTTTMKNED